MICSFFTDQYRNMKTRTLLSLFLLVCLFYPNLQAQTPQQKAPCSDPVYRHMDFWIGDWEVTNPKGDVVGENRIEQILGTCVIMENWTGKGGSVGHSFNIYNRVTERWEQTWVDNGGNVFYFHGNWDEEKGELAYFSETKTAKGVPVLYRMVFTPQEDGTVKQLWEASIDTGREWNTLFNGTYRKKK